MEMGGRGRGRGSPCDKNCELYEPPDYIYLYAY